MMTWFLGLHQNTLLAQLRIDANRPNRIHDFAARAYFTCGKVVNSVICVCLRQRDNNNSRSLERCFVAVDGICCRRMLVGGTAEVQVRDPCTLTVTLKSVN